jgi:hypothetical protein
MTNPIIKIVNAQTGEELEREMTADELQQHEADQAAYQEKILAAQSKNAAKAALLTKLGITADEAALLLG